ncbi:S-adenosyl-L-methionine-dependent methyltransferase [Calocera viscosa TUFC12733]|uniref:S-adenosyl-L-methionine-dependent methyltransferase n=1 Tax=Calocera viscosa (strain TUFC12733) TaxID=1330018 RepID=A0A167PA11_CALVF|nr:S-adenosyl-L-methionine-dependent methyltransferase [Calocera viscosa TUFC12733]
MSELEALRSIINESLDILQTELKAANLPDLWVSKPEMHPLDNLTYVQTPRLFETRRILLGACRMIASAVQPPTEKIIEEGWAHQRSQALHMVCKYNVAGVLAQPAVDQEKGVDAETLAKRFGLSPDPFKREMRMLASHHYFRETSEGYFANNRISMSLVPPNVAPHAIEYIATWGLKVAHRVVDAMDINEYRTGAQLAYGFDTDMFAYIAKHPQYLSMMVSGMTGLYETQANGLIADFAWKDLPAGTTVIDVGGGEGGLMMAVGKANPHLKVLDQDRPEVGPAALANWAKHAPELLKEGRIAFEAHNFFLPQPRSGPDYVYVMRCIIHDWPHEECVTILNHLSKAMLPSSKLLIIEHVIYPPIMPTEKTPLLLASIDNNEPYKETPTPWPMPNGPQVLELVHDIEMFCNFKAKERTPGEWDSLLGECGMKVVKIWPTRTEFSIVEIMLA